MLFTAAARDTRPLAFPRAVAHSEKGMTWFGWGSKRADADEDSGAVLRSDRQRCYKVETSPAPPPPLAPACPPELFRA
eukprot:jgi/Tetstr1/449868/TSEL_036927.t1